MMLKKIQNTASLILKKANFRPSTGIILGSGLGGLADAMDVKAAIEYADIPGFPVSTVAGHKGRLIFGMLGGRHVVAMQGRFHYYEGYAPQEVVFPVRVMKYLGIERLFVSNAAGGINPDFHVGDLMVINDHINLIPNPLVGPNIEELGPRFPDMSEPYDTGLRSLAKEVAAKEGIVLQHGVYVGGTGPTFETQAEYLYFRTIGGDAAGMSTTPEVIAARHMALPVFGISVITNAAFSGKKSTHEEVREEGAKAAEKLTRLITGMVSNI